MVAKVCERTIQGGKWVVPRTIRNCILFGYTRSVTRTDAVGKVAEEIVVEDAGDAPEQVDVNILFMKYLVDIGACAA